MLFRSVTAAIYSIVNLKDDHFRTNIEMNRNPVEVEVIGEELEVLLKGVLGEIYSREGVFTQTVHRERCGVCPYNVLCRRV